MIKIFTFHIALVSATLTTKVGAIHHDEKQHVQVITFDDDKYNDINEPAPEKEYDDDFELSDYFDDIVQDLEEYYFEEDHHHHHDSHDRDEKKEHEDHHSDSGDNHVQVITFDDDKYNDINEPAPEKPYDDDFDLTVFFDDIVKDLEEYYFEEGHHHHHHHDDHDSHSHDNDSHSHDEEKRHHHGDKNYDHHHDDHGRRNLGGDKIPSHANLRG